MIKHITALNDLSPRKRKFNSFILNDFYKLKKKFNCDKNKTISNVFTKIKIQKI